jgi:ubiquinol-cytochrome c reductase cytochrome b subunit
VAAAPESADSSNGGGLIGWIDQRFPLTKLWKGHVAEYYAPKNFNFWYYFGSLALLILVNQLVTGIFLTMNYKPSAAEAFSSVEYIMRDVDWGWLIRYLHSTGASAFFIVVYLHMFRALLYGSHRKPRELVWIFGCLIFLLLMAEGFMGYVLPWGNMSYWGHRVPVREPALYRRRSGRMDPRRLLHRGCHAEPILRVARGRVALGADFPGDSAHHGAA